jgi:hypothetical protein
LETGGKAAEEEAVEQILPEKTATPTPEAPSEVLDYIIRHASGKRLSEEEIFVELRSSKERCYEKSVECVKRIKTSFANVGAYSSEDNFVRGDPEGPIEWISSEAEAFEDILSDRGDVCAFSGARGIAAILEKSGCDHVKALA